MKKGRPAFTVSALADPALEEAIATVLRRETGTLGVRSYAVERWSSTREVQQVDVDGQPVRVKVSPGRAKAEFADVARAAQRLGAPLREVARRADRVAHIAIAGRPPRRRSRLAEVLPTGDRIATTRPYGRRMTAPTTLEALLERLERLEQANADLNAELRDARTAPAVAGRYI